MPPDPAAVARLRDKLRHLEARLDDMRAAPDYTKQHPDRLELMAQVHRLRGEWRRAEAAIGRRVAGMGVGSSRVDPLDTAKLSALTRGYRQAATRNTGRPISGDLADFEQRVQQMFGFDPNRTRLTKASPKAS